MTGAPGPALGVEWFGWGTFRLRGAGGPTVLIDPCVSALLDEPHARLEELECDLILLTHGHHEHIRDLPRVLRRWPRPVFAPPQVHRYLTRGRLVPTRVVEVLHPDAEIDLGGLRITPRSFVHVSKHDVRGKVAVLRDHGAAAAWGRLLPFVPRILSSYAVIRDQPEGGPYLAFDLLWPSHRLFFGCEAFTTELDDATALTWARGAPLDLLLMGVESGHEAAAGRAARRMAAHRVIGATVHAPFERFYGKAPVSEPLFRAECPSADLWRERASTLIPGRSQGP